MQVPQCSVEGGLRGLALWDRDGALSGGWTMEVEEHSGSHPVGGVPSHSVDALSQTVRFDASYGTAAPIVLLELPDAHVRSSIQSGEVCIKGMADQEAMLCTAKRTYKVRLADQSNAMLIAHTGAGAAADDAEPVGGDGWSVLQDVRSYYELVQCAPQLSQLRALLLERPFAGKYDDEEEEAQGRVYTIEELVLLVQASMGEVAKALADMCAVNVKGRFRLLEPEYEREVAQLMLSTVEELSLDPKALSLKRLCAALPDVAPEALLFCLKRFGTKMSGSEYCVKDEAVARFVASELFREKEEWPESDFIEVWGARCLSTISPTLEMLAGLALRLALPVGTILRYFPEEKLSNAPIDRFRALFDANDTWTLAEISPYLTSLEASTGTSTEQLLLRYARGCTRDDGVRVYNSREARR